MRPKKFEECSRRIDTPYKIKIRARPNQGRARLYERLFTIEGELSFRYGQSIRCPGDLYSPKEIARRNQSCHLKESVTVSIRDTVELAGSASGGISAVRMPSNCQVTRSLSAVVSIGCSRPRFAHPSRCALLMTRMVGSVKWLPSCSYHHALAATLGSRHLSTRFAFMG